MEHATKNNLCQRKNVFNPKDNTKKDPDIQKNGNEKLRLIKKANQSKLSRSKLNELRKKANETRDMQKEKQKKEPTKNEKSKVYKHLSYLVKPSENLLRHYHIFYENRKQLLVA